MARVEGGEGQGESWEWWTGERDTHTAPKLTDGDPTQVGMARFPLQQQSPFEAEWC